MKAETLKKSILQLAVEGKLVPQIDTEEPASVLLEKISKEKEQLIKEKKIKRDKNESIIYRENGHFYEKVGKKEPVCIDDEIPFDIPDSWEWCRLGDVFKIIMGQSPKGNTVFEDKGEEEYIEFHQGKTFFGEKILLKSNKVTNDSKKIAEPNSVLLCVRAPVGTVNLLDRKISIGRGLCSIKSYTDCIPVKYIYYAMSVYDKILIKKSTGTTFKAVTKNVVMDILFPIPPLQEQYRIVEKIEEVLPYIEEYDLAERELTKLNKAFPKKVKQSILQYAIEGKLVPQIESEGTAKELLKKISKEKEQLIKEKKIKRDKNESIIYREDGHFYEKVGKKEPVCIDNEIPFDIPNSWEWARLSHLFYFINGDRGKNYPSKDKLLEEGRIPFINAGNINNQSIDDEGLLYIDESRYNLLGSGKLKKNDFVICIRGSIGKFCIYPYDIGAIASSLVILRQISDAYLVYSKKYFSSELFFSEIRKYDNGTAQPNLSAANLKKFFIPIPPLSEQHRIVEKIEEILPLIKELSE